MHRSTPSRADILLLSGLLALLAACAQAPTPNVATGEEPRAGREPEREPPEKVAGERYDLARDEARGGHTLRKHVARTDEQLRERLAEERNISAASTWTDRETAETTVGDALHRERGRLESWMHRGYPRANLALHHDAGRAIGRSLRRGDAHTVRCTSAVIVLRADGPDSFFVLTTYPEARE